MSEIQTIKLDDVEYVRKYQIEQTEKIIQIGAENTIAGSMVGKFVIVRSRNEGINAGTVEAADETGIILKDCRRLYYHRPADNKLSWYEGVAETGLSDNSKVSGTVKRKVIIEDYSMTECTDIAKKSIMEITPNEQN
jgi:hypothetical protein